MRAMGSGSGKAPLCGAICLLFGPLALPYARMSPKWSDPGSREARLGDTRRRDNALGAQLHRPAIGMLRVAGVSGAASERSQTCH